MARSQLDLFALADGPPPPAQLKPIIRFAGGKRWIIPWIGRGVWTHLQRNPGARYIEPFVGGGAVAFWLGQPRMILTDLSEPVIDLYRALAERAGEVVYALAALAVKGVDKESYYQVRDSRPKKLADRAARFLYLNALCFNGLLRENKSGRFNVPYDKSRYRPGVVKRKSRDAVESLFPNRQRLVQAGDMLARCDVRRADFEEVIDGARRGDIVYCDPPYHGGFTAYCADNFGEDDQETLAACLYDAWKRGVTIVASNADTEFIRRIYKWAPVQLRVAESRNINSDARGRGRVGCLLIATSEGLVANG